MSATATLQEETRLSDLPDQQNQRGWKQLEQSMKYD
jgi:hypothetical protein